MTQNYELRVGHSESADADMVIKDIINANISVTENGMSDFTATIPKSTEIRQYLQSNIYLIADDWNEAIWWGTFEQWEQSETGAETTISARGPLVRDSQRTTIETFTDTFADDALSTVASNADTNFTFVLNDRDKRKKQTSVTNDGGGTTGTVENQVTTDTNETYTDWEVYVKYSEELQSSTVGISDTSGGADETETIDSDGSVNFAHGSLSTANPTSDPYTYIDIPTSTASINYIVVFPSDSTQRYIFSEEVDGTTLEALQTLAEIAGYRFSPRNFDVLGGTTGIDTHIMFPVGYKIGSPDWRIIDSNRASDFTNYANEVTVKGDASFTVTVSDDEEIDIVGRTISNFIRRNDAKNTAQARAIAKTKLRSLTENRSESGSLTTTIPTNQADTIVGARTSIGVWSDSFFDGGSEGPNFLYFGEPDATPRVYDTLSNEQLKEFEFLVFAELDRMDNERYLLSEANDPELLKLNPDGSLTFKTEEFEATTRSDVILNETTHNIRLRTVDASPGSVDLYVDETKELDIFDQYVAIESSLYLGNRRREAGDRNPSRVGGAQAAHITFDEATRLSDPYAYENIATGYNDALSLIDTTDTEGSEFIALPPSESQYREGLERRNTSGFELSDADRYDLGTGDLSVAFSLKVLQDGGLEQPVWITSQAYNNEKGYAIYIDESTANLMLAISDGSTNSTYTLASRSLHEEVYDLNKWAHVVVNIDRDGEVSTYINGDLLTTSDITEWSGVDISNTQNARVGTIDPNSCYFKIDELRVYEDLLTQEEIDTISSLTGNYREDFVGGLDYFRYSTDSNEQDLEAGRDTTWRFNDQDTPNTAQDSVYSMDGSIVAAEYGAVLVAPREISYKLIDGITADVKFDIAGRVDTELADVRNGLENTKR